MKYIKVLLFAALCSTWACSTEEEAMQHPSNAVGNIQEVLPTGWTTCRGEMSTTISGYTDEGAITRADGTVTNTWADGSKIYLVIESEGKKVPVVAVYSNTFAEWSFSYDASQSIPSTGTMVAHYFKDAFTTDFNGATLDENSVVYTDSTAQYCYENNTFMVGIHLKPAYFRIRLAGVPGQQVTFSGMSRASSYLANTGEMVKEDFEISLTASSTAVDGRYYTSYVYGSWGGNDSIYTELEDGSLYCRSLKGTGVVAGKSVWTSMPSANYMPKGWKLTDAIVGMKTFTVNGVSFNMISVKKGTFNMGSTTNSDEQPIHCVTLTKNYYIGETEVTQALYKAVMSGSNPSFYRGDQHPVENVSWNNCQTFITKLNELTGQTFRLPTEAEWEFAARGGNKSKGYTYSGSNTVGDVACYSGNYNYGHNSVKSKAPNELGIYDMSGNVCEWCQDWYGNYSSGSQTDPTGASSGSYRVLRGGCWNYNASYCRVAYRNCNWPSNTNDYDGFRLAL